MADIFDISGGRLMEVAGPNRGREVVFEGDRVIFGNLASIERVRGVYLLRALTEDGVKVSDKRVQEKILELNDRIALGDVEIEFSPRGGAGGEPPHVGAPNPHLRLLLAALAGGLLTLGAVSLLLPHRGAGRAQGEKPGIKPSQAPMSPPRRAISEEQLVETLKRARVQFEIAERFHADALVADGNLYLAVHFWDQVVRGLEGIRPEPPIYATATERLARAQIQLEERLKYLKRNAYVAHEIGDQDALRSILREIMDTIPNPSSEHYQWAQGKLLALPPETNEKS